MAIARACGSNGKLAKTIGMLKHTTNEHKKSITNNSRLILFFFAYKGTEYASNINSLNNSNGSSFHIVEIMQNALPMICAYLCFSYIYSHT